MHYISMAAARFELKFAAYAEGPCKPTDGIRPTAKLGLQVGICRSASAANDGITAAGAHAHAAAVHSHAAEVGLQAHQQDTGKNNGPTVDITCSVDQSENLDWIRIERQQ